MSRSRKKAIYKDKGHRKEDYWRIHRRVNKQIVKFFYKSATHRLSTYSNWDDYFEFSWKFEEQGYSEEEASMMAYEEIEDNEDFPICSNFHQDWGEEPNTRTPKELINDYDYSDYRIDYEFDRQRGYYRDCRRDKGSETWKELRNYWAEKLRRK